MREPAKKFEDLVVWQKAHQFVLAVYRLTQFSEDRMAHQASLAASEADLSLTRKGEPHNAPRRAGFFNFFPVFGFY